MEQVSHGLHGFGSASCVARYWRLPCWPRSEARRIPTWANQGNPLLLQSIALRIVGIGCESFFAGVAHLENWVRISPMCLRRATRKVADVDTPLAYLNLERMTRLKLKGHQAGSESITNMEGLVK